jgi:hypothetical protein
VLPPTLTGVGAINGVDVQLEEADESSGTDKCDYITTGPGGLPSGLAPSPLTHDIQNNKKILR